MINTLRKWILLAIPKGATEPVVCWQLPKLPPPLAHPHQLCAEETFGWDRYFPKPLDFSDYDSLIAENDEDVPWIHKMLGILE